MQTSCPTPCVLLHRVFAAVKESPFLSLALPRFTLAFTEQNVPVPRQRRSPRHHRCCCSLPEIIRICRKGFVSNKELRVKKALAFGLIGLSSIVSDGEDCPGPGGGMQPWRRCSCQAGASCLALNTELLLLSCGLCMANPLTHPSSWQEPGFRCLCLLLGLRSSR